ncbi:MULTISPECIES: DUF1852 domain-containing protein [unclassified Moraxella]|uniref:DUF1852 domain-containing protein n=1 Tax=unclassified Moraxella TaxID=2685852 RepID=UPI003AF7EE15
MSQFQCFIDTLRFDEHYQPLQHTRLTTNFANLARGEHREQNLRHTLQMINRRFNDLANWDNPNADRYSVELDIVSVDVDIEGNGERFPAIEVLNTTIVDHHTNQRLDGIIGNSFSSYVRDYDFSVLLLAYNKQKPAFCVPDNFGELHGKLFQYLIESDAYTSQFHKNPVICLSVSHTKTYYQTTNVHPILGVEYQQNEYSLTDDYFAKMGLSVRYFMPPKSVAPFAFYFKGDLLNDYTNLELISTISTMETFQKIYRPEIYNANAKAGQCYRPSLDNPDHSLTKIDYDREERTQLAIKQGQYTEANFIQPHRNLLQQWANTVVL